MSEKNVEIVRRATEAYSRGDLDEALASWSADAVLDWSNSRGLEAAVVRGRDEIRAYMEQFLEAFEEVRIELEDVFEADEGVVIVENLAYFRGRDGIEVTARRHDFIRVTRSPVRPAGGSASRLRSSIASGGDFDITNEMT